MIKLANVEKMTSCSGGQVFLYLIADLVRKAKETRRGEKEQKELPERTIFLLEQPADPVGLQAGMCLFLANQGLGGPQEGC